MPVCTLIHVLLYLNNSLFVLLLMPSFESRLASMLIVRHVMLLVHHCSHFFQQVAGEDKVGETLVLGVHNLTADALPLLMSFEDEDDIFANAHDGVHVVRVDDGGNAEFLGDAVQQVVDNQRCLLHPGAVQSPLPGQSAHPMRLSMLVPRVTYS